MVAGFFAAAHDFLLELSAVSAVRVVVLRLSRVTELDATGAHLLADTRRESRETRGHGAAVRRTPEHQRVLRGLGVHEHLAHERHLFATTPEAIEHARLHAARIGHAPEGEGRDVA